MAEQNAGSWQGTPYQYTGQELDSETGLYYYGARFYDPVVSGFMSVDPLADQFAGWSSYTYTLNNPLRYTDPTGMAPEDTDDWILRANGSIEYDAAINSEKDAFQKYGGGTTYLGSSGTIENESGRLNLNENGSSNFLPALYPPSQGPPAGGALESTVSFGGAIATFVGDYNVSGGKFRGASGRYYGFEGRAGWNQFTGTKAKMNFRLSAAKISTLASRGFGLVSAGISTDQWLNGELSNTAFGIELGSAGIGTLAPPIISLPWIAGYEGLGRQGVARLKSYQEFKRQLHGIRGGSDGLISTKE